MAKKWKETRDPLFRGDLAEEVRLPTPAADPSMVRHILYLDGAGRETPYLSTSEWRDIAELFAGREGRVWQTKVPRAKAEKVRHLSRRELVQLLRGKGKGAASWPSPFEVMQARRYVEEWREHLLDFRELQAMPHEEIRRLVDRIFEKALS